MNEQKIETVILSCRIPKEVREKLEAIQSKRCFMRLNDALIYIIGEMHDKEFNNYKELIKNRPVRTPLTEEEKVVKQVARADAREEAKRNLILEKGRAICSTLDGTVINHGNGSFGCEYVLYEKVGKTVLKGKRIVPLDLLTDEHVELQYKGGSKAEVQELLASK